MWEVAIVHLDPFALRGFFRFFGLDINPFLVKIYQNLYSLLLKGLVDSTCRFYLETFN